MMYYIFAIIALLCTNFTFIETCTEMKTINSLNDQIDELSLCQSDINVTFYEIKALVQDSLEANQLPVAEIYTAARANITNQTQVYPKEVAEKCINDKEFDFVVLFRQVSETMLTCVESKSRKILIPLLDVQDLIDDKLKNLLDLKNKCNNSRDKTEESKCQQEVEDIEAFKKLLSQARQANTDSKVLSSRLKDCADHLVTFIRFKVNEIVKSVKECGNNQNQNENEK